MASNANTVFSHPLNIDRCELEMLLYCYSPNRGANQPVETKLQAPLDAYIAAGQAIDLIEPMGFGTLRDYIAERSCFKAHRGNELLRMYIEKLPSVDQSLGECVLRRAEMAGKKYADINAYLLADEDDPVIRELMKRMLVPYEPKGE